jgi:hypothetical protein
MHHAIKRYLGAYPNEIFNLHAHWQIIKIVSNSQRATTYLELKFIK